MDTTDDEIIPMKCRKCRFLLLEHPQVCVEDSHSSEEQSKKCVSEVWYVPEEFMPEWMKACMEKGEWVKGKIKCPNQKCEARIGSYNFVTGFKCPCGSRVVPPIHIVKSKVDFTPPFYISIQQINPTAQVQLSDAVQ